MRTARLPRPAPDDWGDARVVVVVAHPDDEVLGCGALLARLRDVTVIHVTDGASREGTAAARHGFATPADYAAARRIEALTALAIAGLGPDRLHGLGVADQAVPAAIVTITHALRPLIDGASVVLTHTYEGGHGDHDAVAFAAHAACRLIEAARRPVLVEMPFYHADATGWVRQQFLPVPPTLSDSQTMPAPPPVIAKSEATKQPRGTGLWAASPTARRDGRRRSEVCDDNHLAIDGAARHLLPDGERAIEQIVRVLTPGERDLKARMIAAHATQAGTLRDFPLDAERFRFAPAYDFTRRPHDGPLLYERYGWSLTWPLWTAHIAAARAAFGLAAP